MSQHLSNLDDNTKTTPYDSRHHTAALNIHIYRLREAINCLCEYNEFVEETIDLCPTAV